MQTFRLGKNPPRRTGKSRLRASIAKTFLDSLPTAPAECDYTSGIIDWGMMLNGPGSSLAPQGLGDCTEAAKGHLLQAWTAKGGKEVTLPDSVILGAYESECGYVNGDPSTDQGGDILTVLNDWQANGLGGYKITAHAEVNLTQMRVQQGLYVFGGLDFGIQLPLTAQDQVGSRWSIVGDGKGGPSAPGSWGGHSVAAVAYMPTGLLFVTWGALQWADWDWVMLYADEAWAAISPNFTSPAPIASLAADLQEVTF
jgi:hypothetical protein